MRRSLPALLALLLIAGAAGNLLLDNGVRAADKLFVPRDYASIQAAVNASSDGDVIVVKGGPYYEHVVLNNRNDLTIRGRKVVIDNTGEMACVTVYRGSGNTISGFTVQGAHTAISGNETEDLTIENCVIQDTTASGVNLYGCNGVLVTRCVIRDTGWYGIGDDISTGLVIVKNTFENTGNDAIALTPGKGGPGTVDSVIAKNRIYDAGDFGVVLGGQRIRVEKNRIVAPASGGIVCSGSTDADSCVVEKNRVTGGGGVGIAMQMDNHSVSKNRVTGVGGTGISIDGSDCTVSKNNVKDPGDHGVEVSGEDNDFEKNKVKGAAGNGFDVTGTGHEFTKNAAKASTGWGLYDHSYTALNTYTKNRFDSEYIEPPK